MMRPVGGYRGMGGCDGSGSAIPALEPLEPRLLLSAAFDLIGLTQLRADPTYAGIDGSGVSVAIIDTGLDRTHPLLSLAYLGGADIANGGTDPIDENGHGTHVAGIIGARSGEVGVAVGTGLIGLRATPSGSAGLFYNTDLERALQWVLDNKSTYNIVAVNLSLGAGFYTSEGEVVSDIKYDEVQRLEAAGVAVIAAIGNSYKDHEYLNSAAPAIYSTLAVGSVWQDGVYSGVQWGSGAIDYSTGADRLSSFSQRHSLDNVIFAPGAIITSTVPGGGQAGKGGTSMAAPMVAGAVALLQEASMQFGGRYLTTDEVRTVLVQTADTIYDGDDEDDNVVNTNRSYPRMNVYAAVQRVREMHQGIEPPPPGGGGVDPNGTMATAYQVRSLDAMTARTVAAHLGSDGSGTAVGGKDVDMYRVTIPTPGELIVETQADPAHPDHVDTYLRLFDSNGVQLAADDDSGTGSYSLLRYNAPAGTYYLGVSGYANTSYNPAQAGSGVVGDTGYYRVIFNLTSGDPNGTLQGAVPTHLSTDREEPLIQNGYIGSDLGVHVGPGDVDIFEVRVPDNGTLLLDIDTPFSTDWVDSFLRVFDSAGNQLYFNDDGLAYDANGNPTEFTDDSDPAFDGLVFSDPVDRAYFHGHTYDSFLAARVDRGSVYYVAVSDYRNQTYSPTSLAGRSTAGTGGYYNLKVGFVSNDQNGSITKAWGGVYGSLPQSGLVGLIGFDTNLATYELMTVGDRDVDFFHINSPTSGILEVQTRSYTSNEVAANNRVDTMLFLFDPSGVLLASNDDADSFDPMIQYHIEAHQSYYVAVAGYGNDDFDPFLSGSGLPGDTGEYRYYARLRPLSDIALLRDDTLSSGAVSDIAVGQTLLGNVGSDGAYTIGPADVDIYRLTAAATGPVAIEVTGYDAFGADTFLRLFDANGVELSFNDNRHPGTTGSYVRTLLQAGQTYYIGVNGASALARAYNPLTGAGAAAGSRGSYALSVTAVAPGPGDGAAWLFHAGHYLAANPDVASVVASGGIVSGYDHWLRYGQWEGRDFSPYFDGGYYLTAYPDVAQWGGATVTSALTHFSTWGAAEGRSPSPYFDARGYVAENPDVAAAPIIPAEHYFRWGHAENRKPSRWFDPAWYAQQNPDIAPAVAGGLVHSSFEHFVRWGLAENRSATPYFNVAFYLAANPDVAAAVASGAIAAEEHFVLYGQRENRTVSPFFDAAFYLSAYPEIASAVTGRVVTSAYEHFVDYGIAEGRKPNAFFDPGWYLSAYPDVPGLAYRHYLLFGASEGRSPSAEFDENYYRSAYPDILAAIQSGAFRNGLHHYLQWGRAESRQPRA